MPRMSEDKSDAARNQARKEREERLAVALRANLRRRKAAARLAPETPAEEAPESTSGSEGVAK